MKAYKYPIFSYSLITHPCSGLACLGGGTGTTCAYPNCLWTRSGEYTSTQFMYMTLQVVIQSWESFVQLGASIPPIAISAILDDVHGSQLTLSAVRTSRSAIARG